MNNTQKSHGRWVVPAFVVFVLVAFAMVLGPSFFGSFDISRLSGAIGIDSPSPSASASATPSPSASAECIKVVPANSKSNRLYSEGIIEIKNAKDAKSAQQAFYAWLDEARKTPAYLAPTVKLLLGEDVAQKSLVDGDCISAKALEYDTRLRAESLEWSFAPSLAPRDGFNTGVQNGQVVRSATPGITGNRTAIMITLKDGRRIWIMYRCGNFVTIERPPLPPGPTDNPPKKSNPDKPTIPTHEPTPTPTPTPTPETGKDHTKAPAQAKETVVTCKSGYHKPRGSDYCVKDAPSTQNNPPAKDDPSGEEPGKGDSGEGATDTTKPPPTTQPPAEVTPVQPTPTSNPEMP